MSSANRYPGIDPRIVASVRHHARRASGRLSGIELEDLEQELMLHAHRRLDSTFLVSEPRRGHGRQRAKGDL
jgi:DNA-directed RNA polymerase specialized sigma24 family protein